MNKIKIVSTGIWLVVLCAVTAPRAWVSLTMPSATAYVRATGMPVEWEWLDAAQTASFFEGDPSWRNRGGGYLTDQNASRTVAPVFISIVGKWVHDAWLAAVICTWFVWCVCVWAIVKLTRESGWIGSTVNGLTAAGTASVVLSATATGFLGNVGDIDAHVFGYAAVAVGLLLFIVCIARPLHPPGLGRVSPTLVGFAIFILDGTLQLGAPLVGFASGLLLWRGVWLPQADRRHEFLRFGKSLVVFVGLAVVWVVIARTGSDGVFDVHNEAFSRSREALTDPAGLLLTFPFKAVGVLRIALDLFRWWLVAAAFVGWFAASGETKVWTLGWIGLIVFATVLTRYTASTVYLMFPAVYVLASICAGLIADRIVPLLPMRVADDRGKFFAVAVGVSAVSFIPAVTQLSFLWGDYTMPAVWWPGP
jgi:hypothetical protein